MESGEQLWAVSRLWLWAVSRPAHASVTERWGGQETTPQQGPAVVLPVLRKEFAIENWQLSILNRLDENGKKGSGRE